MLVSLMNHTTILNAELIGDHVGKIWWNFSIATFYAHNTQTLGAIDGHR